MASFFHATREIYVPGVLLDAVEQTRFFTRRLADPRFARTEAVLELHRPLGAVSRRLARFACESVADCAAYLSGEQYEEDDRPVRYYRVTLPESTRAPMLLIDYVYRQVERNEQYVAQVAREYWTPTQPWRFWEVLGSAMIIEEEVEGPEQIAAYAGFSRAMADKRLRDRLWP